MALDIEADLRYTYAIICMKGAEIPMRYVIYIVSGRPVVYDGRGVSASLL